MAGAERWVSVETFLSHAVVVGERGRVNLGGLDVVVMVLDAKTAWGKTRYLVTPVTGAGSVWVDGERVRPEVKP